MTKRKYSKRSSSTPYDKLKIGKPMPPFAVLKKMFEDDNDEEPQTQRTDQIMTPKPHHKTYLASSAPEIMDTSENLLPRITLENLRSPRTIKKIANQMMGYIANMADSILLVDDEPPPPIIQPKKQKKPEEAYIVGCKGRQQIPMGQYSSTNFCRGDNDYGVISGQGENTDEENLQRRAKKRAKTTEHENQSDTKFNSNNDKTAMWYKDYDKLVLSDDSNDSNKTLLYEFGEPFSPTPSTSKDSDTILENDKKFNKCCKLGTNVKMEKKQQVIETIIIDDVYVPEYSKINKSITIKNETDDCTKIIDRNHDTKRSQEHVNLDIVNLDYYDFPDNDLVFHDVSETIDIDKIIAENNSIIDKFTEVKKLNSVTCINSSTTSFVKVESKDDDTVNIETANKVQNSARSGPYLSEQNERPEVNISNNTNNIIQTIVTSYFQNRTVDKEMQTDNTNLLLGMVMSQYGETIFILFNNFTNWLKSFTITKRCKNKKTNVNIQVPHEDPENDVIVIHDNSSSIEQWHDELLPPNPHSVNNKVSTIDLTVSKKTNITTKLIEDSTLISMQETTEQLSHLVQQHQAIRQALQNQKILPLNTLLQIPATSPLRAPTQCQRKTIVTQPTVSAPPSLVTPQCPKSTIVLNDHVTPAPPVKPLSNKKSIGDCPICMDSLSNNAIASTMCGHLFCLHCIKTSLKSNGKRCPTCRKELKGAGYHMIYI